MMSRFFFLLFLFEEGRGLLEGDWGTRRCMAGWMDYRVNRLQVRFFPLSNG